MIVYTTAEKIQRRMSTIAVDLRLDDLEDQAIEQTAAYDQVIEDASVEVNGYCLTTYSAAALAASPWIEKKTRDIAIYFLCLRRLNKAPASVQAEYEKALADLERVQAGEIRIPDAPQSRATVPVMSNQGVRLDPVPHTVVDRNRSTGPVPQGYVQQVEPYDW